MVDVYGTPSVNQYWAIVNAILLCNIIYSLSLEICFFQAYINCRKDWLSTVVAAQEGEGVQSGRSWVRAPYGALLLHKVQV